MNAGLTAGQQLIETVQSVRDLYDNDEEDDDEELSAMTDQEKDDRAQKQRAETVQQLLRANHVAQASRLLATSKLLDNKGEKIEYLEQLEKSQRDKVDQLNAIMPQERARPSIVEPVAGPMLNLLVQACDMIGRSKDRDILISAIEKGV